uniref:non-specific serine/threonine protein kinase n=1 Tax=Lotharella globosa TaxID=91324 RepID=A0A7S4E088_9EUKA
MGSTSSRAPADRNPERPFPRRKLSFEAYSPIDYKLGPVLGIGTHGEVRCARRISDGRPVAIKIIDRTKLSKSALDQLFNEVVILKSLDHRNVIKILEVKESVPHRGTWCDDCACSEFVPSSSGAETCRTCRHSVIAHCEEAETRDAMMIVQELAPAGELFDIVAQGPLKEDFARYYFKQLVDGLEHCHSRGVIHRDLKPENLVLGGDFSLKIIDFGLAVMGRSLHHFAAGTQKYMAPEALQTTAKGYRGKPADVWSCGVILYVMLKGSTPFRRPLLESIGSSRRLRRCSRFVALMRGESYAGISPEARRLLEKIFVLDPNKRITLAEIKQDPWLHGSMPNNEDVAQVMKAKAIKALKLQQRRQQNKNMPKRSRSRPEMKTTAVSDFSRKNNHHHRTESSVSWGKTESILHFLILARAAIAVTKFRNHSEQEEETEKSARNRTRSLVAS